MMLIQSLQLLFERDIEKLKTEINAYQEEKNLWIVDKNISNSAGNLALHLVGNLKTYFGTILGNTGYERNRPLEFSAKNINRQEIITAIDEAKLIVITILNQLTEEQLIADYPATDTSYGKTSTYHYLIHLSVHLSYHLGQINYHRRLFDN
ncbi:DinB family protein [Flavobacterium sp.]|uniref:DinB family protein n=1 Tax=Flavobacterium sp. TaxID=239 RepID=UPI003D1248BD